MNCAVHTDATAAGFCRNCGKPLCPACVREVKGVFYCEDCLAAMMATPAGSPAQNQASSAYGSAAPDAFGNAPPGAVPVPPPAAAGASNPALACLLGFIPGLGAVYNGEYMKALLQALIFGGIVAALSADLPDAADAILAVAFGAFYFYMPVDAYRSARARQQGQPGTGFFSEGTTTRQAGPIILIILGVLFLLGNLGILRADWIGNAWPAGLIILGGYLLWKRMQTR